MTSHRIAVSIRLSVPPPSRVHEAYAEFPGSKFEAIEVKLWPSAVSG